MPIPSNEEIFQNWLDTRRITYRSEWIGNCFDTDIVALNKFDCYIRGTAILRHYHYTEQLPSIKDKSFVSQQKREAIASYLEELESDGSRDGNEGNLFLRAEVGGEAMTDFGEPLVESVRKYGRGDLEPVWSVTGIQNPAELLLPMNQRLGVEELETTKELYWIPPVGSNIGFKNNMFCVYGAYVFVAHDELIQIHHVDSLTRTAGTRMMFETKCCLSVLNKNVWLQLDAIGGLEEAERMCENHHRKHCINFIRVCKFFELPVIAACLDNGTVLMYSIASLINEHKLVLDRKSASLEYLETLPLAAFKTRDSCWSVDTMNLNDDVVLVAAGNNGPSIGLFAYDRRHARTYSLEQVTSHNVPCVNFIPNSLDKDGYVTLTYASIYGNVTALKLRLEPGVDPQTNIGTTKVFKIKHLDSQFFGEYAWNVIPLERRDFMHVPSFELLNLNFQENFKKSILYSIVLDTVTLRCGVPNTLTSRNLGLGTLTTQVPVPTAALDWRCQNGVPDCGVDLRFTTFDEDGVVPSGSTRSSGNWVGETYSRMMGRPAIERMASLYTRNLMEQFYFNGERPVFWPTGLAKRRYERWWNSKLKIGPRPISLLPFRGPSIEDDDSLFRFTDLRDEVMALVNDTTNRHIYTSTGGVSEPECLSCIPNTAWIPKGKIIAERCDKTQLLWSSIVDENASKSLDALGIIQGYGFENDDDDDESNDNNNKTITAEVLLQPSNTFKRAPGETLDSDYDEQRIWSNHNHVKKVRRLLDDLRPDSYSTVQSPSGYVQKTHPDDYLLVTTARHVYLLKAYPLLVLSYTRDEIFPTENVSLCVRDFELIDSLNRINFVCHIKELHCVAVASQLGLVSLLRLTEFNGIVSFRQEYILGWHSQVPGEQLEGDECISWRLQGVEQQWMCVVCDVGFPLFNITGMDYSYVPEDIVNGISEHAILYVVSSNSMHRFKILPGQTAVISGR